MVFGPVLVLAALILPYMRGIGAGAPRATFSTSATPAARSIAKNTCAADRTSAASSVAAPLSRALR